MPSCTVSTSPPVDATIGTWAWQQKNISLRIDRRSMWICQRNLPESVKEQDEWRVKKKTNYRPITHGMELNEPTRLKPTWHQHEVCPSCYHVCQWGAEFYYTHSLVGKLGLQFLQLLLQMFLSCALVITIGWDATRKVMKPRWAWIARVTYMLVLLVSLDKPLPVVCLWMVQRILHIQNDISCSVKSVKQAL